MAGMIDEATDTLVKDGDCEAAVLRRIRIIVRCFAHLVRTFPRLRTSKPLPLPHPKRLDPGHGQACRIGNGLGSAVLGQLGPILPDCGKDGVKVIGASGRAGDAARIQAPGGRPMANFSIAFSKVSASVPFGSRHRMSESRLSSSSMVKPCTSDQARAIAAACSSDSASL